MATSKEMTAGPALPLIFISLCRFVWQSVAANVFAVDAIVGKFLGNALASVGASTSVVFLFWFLQRMLWRIRYPRGTSLGRGLWYDAQLRFRRSATCCCDVCDHSHLYQYLLCGYPEDDAYTGEYL